MDIRKLQRAIVDGLEDVKGHDIVVFNTEHLSPLFERVIIASGTSNRQTKALASSVRNRVKDQGGTVLATEGTANGEWIIVDCGAAVAHILQPALRHYYHLEEIWGGKPVNMKLATVARGLVKASEPEDDEPEPAAPARKAAKKAAKSAAKAPARTAAKKAAPRNGSQPPATKTAKTARKAPARAPAARKAVAGKTPARKAARKTAAGSSRPAAKKAPARKTAAKSSPKRAPRG